MQCVPVCKFATNSIGKDAANSVYVIDGKSIALEGGQAKAKADAGSATIATTRIFDASTRGDLNGDGREDVAVLLVQDPGGSGTFYYVAAALRTEDGYQGTNAILIGDRISPQTVEMRDRTITVNYADRYPWEGFAARPSVSRSRYFAVKNDELKEKPFAVLDQKVARELVIRRWADCKPGTCSKLIVNVLDGRGGVWYVEAIYDGMMDDSVRAKRKVAETLYENEEWKLGKVLLEQQSCRAGRGHENFSSNACR